MVSIRFLLRCMGTIRLWLKLWSRFNDRIMVSLWFRIIWNVGDVDHLGESLGSGVTVRLMDRFLLRRIELQLQL